MASAYRSWDGLKMPESGMSFAMIGGGSALEMRSAMANPGWPCSTRAASLMAALVLIVPNVMTWATFSSPHLSTV